MAYAHKARPRNITITPTIAIVVIILGSSPEFTSNQFRMILAELRFDGFFDQRRHILRELLKLTGSNEVARSLGLRQRQPRQDYRANLP